MGVFLGALEYVLEEGNSNDWFNDSSIAIAAVASGVAAIVFFYRAFTVDFPVVDLKAFSNRNFSFGSVFSFVMLYDPSHYVLQCLDYLDNIDIYKDRIKMFHVKDAEFNPTGRQGVYGGYQGWVERAGRFRSLGDGQVDFGAVFSKMTANNFDGWAVVEWECALKHPEDGAREGAEFVAAHIIRVTEKAFDDFAGSGTDQAANRRMLGL